MQYRSTTIIYMCVCVLCVWVYIHRRMQGSGVQGVVTHFQYSKRKRQREAESKYIKI